MKTTQDPKKTADEESREPNEEEQPETPIVSGGWDLRMGAEAGTPITVGGDGEFSETPTTVGAYGALPDDD